MSLRGERRWRLLSKVELLAPYICKLEGRLFWFHTDLIKCCCTTEDGRFETPIWYQCAGDKPDLYFKAVQCIGGTLHTLYDPGLACHTYWNYACGTEVVLETHDPAAITCAPQEPVEPPPGVALWVMPDGVGGIRLDQIKSSGLTYPLQNRWISPQAEVPGPPVRRSARQGRAWCPG